MANIKISISATGIATDNLRVVAYEASAPNTEVDSQLLAAPHTLHNITFSGLNDVLHIVRIYQTATSSGGTLRNEFNYDPLYTSADIRLPLFIEVDVTTGLVSATTAFEQDDLEGWDFDLERRGFGTMEPDVDYTKDTKGFTLLGAGDEFQPNEKFVLRFSPKITTVSNSGTSSTSKLWLTNDTITADIDLDASDMGTMFDIEGSGLSVVVTLPELASVVNNKLIFFNSDGGNHINAVLRCFAGDEIRFKGEDITDLILGQGEHVWLYPYGGMWKVAQADGGFDIVGQFFFSATNDTTLLKNALYCDGTELLRSSYPRLWAFIDSLPGAIVISNATWLTGTTNKYLFSSGDGSTTFRLPDLRGQFIRGTSGTRATLTFEAEDLKAHFHGNGVADDLGTAFVYGSITTDLPGSSTQGIQTDNSARTKQGKTQTVGGTSTRPDNVAMYIMIRI